ncbi:MAG: hypothetical protein H8K10_07710 [Nitrospira sp.]|nr:hypothetical protein [Nitrospira sp.]
MRNGISDLSNLVQTAGIQRRDSARNDIKSIAQVPSLLGWPRKIVNLNIFGQGLIQNGNQREKVKSWQHEPKKLPFNGTL